MNPRRKWIIDFVVPLLAAGIVAATRWGDDNLILMLVIPIFVLLFRMAEISWQRTESLDSNREARAYMANWQALSILASLFLMGFEAAAAGFAEGKRSELKIWMFLMGGTYAPYAGLTLLAGRYLRRARSALAQPVRTKQTQPAEGDDHSAGWAVDTSSDLRRRPWETSQRPLSEITCQNSNPDQPDCHR